ncbi:MAG: GTPase HflX [Deltaproteobacteria bacterium]|nr:GTPase HflX [Deltaproteobacteria bacterium]
MKTLLVGVILNHQKFSCLASLEETKSLCIAENLELGQVIIQKRSVLDARSLVGLGKLKEIAEIVQREKYELVVFDQPLKPAQWKTVTSMIPVKVLDKYMLILDIFARRAQTAEGKLKVELAQLEYNLPRLTELDSGLSRLVGGIGGRGPGETKLEMSRRRSRERIKLLQTRLAEIEKRRELATKLHKKNRIPLVSLVGYTNVGKSALFNALTAKEDAFVQDKLFATLDPLRRRLNLSDGSSGRLDVVLADTVGFISDLPKQLYDAFKATIKEVAESQLILLVVDASDNRSLEKYHSVLRILSEIGANPNKFLVILNKIDIANEKVVHQFINIPHLEVSALKKINIKLLKREIFQRLIQFRAIETHTSVTVDKGF